MYNPAFSATLAVEKWAFHKVSRSPWLDGSCRAARHWPVRPCKLETEFRLANEERFWHEPVSRFGNPLSYCQLPATWRKVALAAVRT